MVREELIKIAREMIDNSDPSHDFSHAHRVLLNAEQISKSEGGDLEIIIPAALFHDLVVYPKNHPHSKFAPQESANLAKEILANKVNFPPEKIAKVQKAIIEHSFSNGLKPSTLESQIIQDADKLEATGAISIMRTFSSTGQMQREFYNIEDPFCETHTPDPFQYGLDLFYERLLRVENLMNTKTGQRLTQERTKFLHFFLNELKSELNIIN